MLGLESTEIRVYSPREQIPCNGHIESTCYHLLLLFNPESDCWVKKKTGLKHCTRKQSLVYYPSLGKPK